MCVMLKGQRFICENPDCWAVLQVTKDSTEGTSNPRCCCGAEMKKLDSRPIVKATNDLNSSVNSSVQAAAKRGTRLLGVVNYNRGTLLVGAILCFLLSSGLLYLLIQSGLSL